METSSLVDVLRFRAQYESDKTAYIFLQNGETESGRLTYGELDRQAMVIANSLKSYQGERALMFYPSGLEFITAFFGCLYAGVIAAPVYPPRRNHNLSRLVSIAKDARAKLALTTTSLLDDINRSWHEDIELTHVKLLATDSVQSSAEEFLFSTVKSENLAFLQYTSGSTGNPKGVMVTHGNIMHNQEVMRQGFGTDEQTIYVCWLPLFHDMGLVSHLLHAMYLGAPCVIMPPVAFLQQPIRWLKAISKYKATISGAPNFAFDLCVSKVKTEELIDLDLSSWETPFNGAEPVRVNTMKQFSNKFADYGFNYRSFYPCYGMAEVTLLATGGNKYKEPIVLEVESEKLAKNIVVKTEDSSIDSHKLVGCGHCYSGTKVAIVNPESLTGCNANEVGEIWLSGGSVALGYWNRPELTEKTFQAYLKDTAEGPFLRTGDLGFLHNEELFVTGRLKDVIIVRGRNVYPQDIELTIEQAHPEIRESCSAAFSVEVEGEERLVLVCEVQRSYLRKLNLEEIVRKIKLSLSTEHELDLFGLVLISPATIPKTSSGKIQRQACKHLYVTNTFSKVVGQWCKGIEINQQVKEKMTGQENDLQKNGNKKHDKKNAEIESWLIRKIAGIQQMSISSIDLKQPFAAYGLNSVEAIQISADLEEWLGISLSPTVIYDYPNIQILTSYLSESSAISSPNKRQSAQSKEESIAIIGKGCRLPKAEKPEAFWELLRTGGEGISQVSATRWQSNRDWGGFLEQVDRFDAQFFNISPLEANNIDPQQRLLLEVSWEALENAGLAVDKLSGSKSGVFIGICGGDYAKLNPNSQEPGSYYATGNASSLAANRLSYFLDWHGPSWAVDTACSSSLVAVHQACQSLLLGECNLAVAGGVNIMLHPQLHATFTSAKMMAEDGHCKTFDAAADGYVRAEGCGVVVLKRLTDAIADGDSIQAIIRGSAVNQDGATNGITAPNGKSQQEVIRLALAKAVVAPKQISYVETHGTGTALGDPIEVNALKAVLMEDRELDRPCWIGSVKTNIGHLEAAAGVASLIKVILCLEHGEIPPHLHFKELNPYIQLDGTSMKIPMQLTSWSSMEPSRLAGISAFGFGGTNAHIIVESAPNQAKIQPQQIECQQRPLNLLSLSAKTEVALKSLVVCYQKYLEQNSQVAVADICFSANTGRSKFNHRLVIPCSDRAELAEKLADFAAGKENNGVYTGMIASSNPIPKIAFLFTGQGSQYVDMGRHLYESQLTFRQSINECANLVDPYLDRPLISVLYPELSEDDTTLTSDAVYAQPALFAVEYAIYQLWISWGINPSALLGHSLGEYVAAVVAGVMSLADGIKLVMTRAKLMQNLSANGEMIAVFAAPAEIDKVISIDAQNLSFAVYNGPQNSVISGNKEAVELACNTFKKVKIAFKKLPTSHAFHSSMVESILPEFRQVAAGVNYQAAQIPFISNLTGKQIEANEIDAEYWCQHLRNSVRFADGLQALNELGISVFLEIGSKPTLVGIGQQCLGVSNRVWLNSLRPKREDWEEMLNSLAQLTVNGAEVDWVEFDRGFDRQRISLPTYPFQRKSYWIHPPQEIISLAPTHSSHENLTFTPENSSRSSVDMTNQQCQQDILNQLHVSVAKLLKAERVEVDINAPFLEMGADSLVLMEAIGYVERTFGVKITIRQIFEELTTIALLAKYIYQQLPAEIISPEPVLAAVSNNAVEKAMVSKPLSFSNVSSALKSNEKNGHGTDSSEIFQRQGNSFPSNDYVAATSLERIIQQQMQTQLQLMSKQLDILQSQNKIDSSTQDRSVLQNNRQIQDTQPTELVSQASVKKKTDFLGNGKSSSSSFWRFDPNSDKQLSQQQQQHLAALIARYTQRTQKSKQRAQSCRSFLADKRAAMGFRFETKEMIYPITGERSLGSKVWDIDGNEYIDISMGFGVHLFGHSEPFIMSALESQLKRGFQIGPLSQFSDKVALLISELTGMERVCFANSGTEAVMTAIRLARAATGRNLIVIFRDAYHGHFDGVLAVANKNQGQRGSVPMAPGVTQNAVDDVLVLAYDDLASLEVIKTRAHELAAVLVEPVPSRRPNVQPQEFLQQLRELTQEIDAALIFDEVITGFRIHPGGAQAWFGVEADIATYGKIVGGGMPIGVIAGKAMYLDGIDGGSWNYGDKSYPVAETTFFAGTFSRNPLAMAAAYAVLSEVKSAGLPLYQRLNQCTTEFAKTVNAFFTAAKVPIQIVSFGSLFRFALAGNASYLYQPLEMDLFYHHLIEKGIYVWEGRTCFLSTAHTEEDIKQIVRAIESTVREMQAGGFWSQSSSESTTLSPKQQQVAVDSWVLTPKADCRTQVVQKQS